MEEIRPRLRTVEKYEPLYRLNDFPPGFAQRLGKELVYLLMVRRTPRLEGTDWEEIFARLIGATWKPSVVGLDDIVFEQCAWGAKTVKARSPSEAKKVRLISGRNSLDFSFGVSDVKKVEPQEVGNKVLSIWNERVYSVRKLYKHLRTVVLVKSEDLLEVAVFEVETCAFMPEQFKWTWNEKGNLCGFNESGAHKFTWQPHGAQFTIVEEVPTDRLALRVKQPPALEPDQLLTAIGYEDSWIQTIESEPTLVTEEMAFD
jgi:hypothetical protein